MNENNEGNQIHNYIFCSGSGTVINYGSGSDFLERYSSGSASQKVPKVPVPFPVPTFEKLWFRFRFLLLKSYGSGSGTSSISRP